MATLTTTVTESLTLNGKDQGSTYTESNSTSVTQSYKRIIGCHLDTRHELFGLVATGGVAGAFDFDQGSLQYVRITNLHTTRLNLIFNNHKTDGSANQGTAVVVPPGKSFMFYGYIEAQASAITESEAANPLSYGAVVVCYGLFDDTSAGNVEIFVAVNADA
jgi:hypothetical protein